ncbi:hypothetical protein ACHAXS_004139, partial [Conticribra weissflogii]
MHARDSFLHSFVQLQSILPYRLNRSCLSCDKWRISSIELTKCYCRFSCEMRWVYQRGLPKRGRIWTPHHLSLRRHHFVLACDGSPPLCCEQILKKQQTWQRCCHYFLFAMRSEYRQLQLKRGMIQNQRHLSSKRYSYTLSWFSVLFGLFFREEPKNPKNNDVEQVHGNVDK